MFEDINLPIQHVDLACGNKNCRSQDKIGVCICFSPECTIYNSHRPIRSAASRQTITCLHSLSSIMDMDMDKVYYELWPWLRHCVPAGTASSATVSGTTPGAASTTSSRSRWCRPGS